MGMYDESQMLVFELLCYVWTCRDELMLNELEWLFDNSKEIMYDLQIPNSTTIFSNIDVFQIAHLLIPKQTQLIFH